MVLIEHQVTLYDLLAVSSRAGASVITAAYRCLAQHPEKHAESKQASERTAHSNHAY